MRFSRQRKAPVILTLPLTEILAKVGFAIVRDRPRLYGNNCLCDRLRSAIRDRLRSYGNQPLESVEEYSEGKIHKSEPKPGNGNVNTVYFVNQARGNT